MTTSGSVFFRRHFVSSLCFLGLCGATRKQLYTHKHGFGLRIFVFYILYIEDQIVLIQLAVYSLDWVVLV